MPNLKAAPRIDPGAVATGEMIAGIALDAPSRIEEAVRPRDVTGPQVRLEKERSKVGQTSRAAMTDVSLLRLLST